MWLSKCRATSYVAALHWTTPPPNQKAIQCVMIFFSAYSKAERKPPWRHIQWPPGRRMCRSLTLVGSFLTYILWREGSAPPADSHYFTGHTTTVRSVGSWHLNVQHRNYWQADNWPYPLFTFYSKNVWIRNAVPPASRKSAPTTKSQAD